MESDRNLLFVLLALQLKVVDRDNLVSGFERWKTDRTQPLERCLIELGCISDVQANLLNQLVDQQLLIYGGDIEKSLGALGSISLDAELRDELQECLEFPDTLTIGISQRLTGKDWTATRPAESTSTTGRYKVLRRHAEGGLGIVSVALDSELNREVALKEIKPAWVNDGNIRSRFVMEAEITGGLEHPGIVPVYGLGVQDDGRPFYAMRFVRGENLRDSIKQLHQDGRTPSTLEFRKLLDRFLDVCRAIHYAHSKGVLHRDIKPANVMLGNYGETLVVDWGLGKITDRLDGAFSGTFECSIHSASASGSDPTMQGSAIGSPPYMSPEQAEGRLDELSPSSDVYSLGAMLYEILTGQPPFDGRTADEVVKKVKQGQFRRPRELKTWIPGPLEAICHQAMSFEPSSRYQSADEIASDIENWLADEPVSAWREPLSHRVRRWMRRHPAMIATATAAFILVGIGAAVVAWQQNRHTAEISVKNKRLEQGRLESIALQEKAEVREKMAVDAIRKFRDVVVENPQLKNNSALQSLRKRLLEEPLAFFEGLTDLLENDLESSSDSLERLAFASFDLGNLIYEIGNKQDAIRAYQQAVEIHERLVRENPTVTEYQRNLATSHNNKGASLYASGQPDKAIDSYQQALEIRERLAIENPTVTKYQSGLADVHSNIGILLDYIGQTDEAMNSYQRALEIYERLVRENPKVTKYENGLADVHNNIGGLLDYIGQPDEAMSSYMQTLEIYEQLVRENPTVTKYQSGLADVHRNIGILLEYIGQPDEAMSSYMQALEIHEKLAIENPSATEYQSDLADSHHNIGSIFSEIGQTQQSMHSYQKALEIRERLVIENPTVTEFQSELAGCHCDMGVLLINIGQTDEAMNSLQKALEIGERLVIENPKVTEYQHDRATNHYNIGSLLKEIGQTNEAMDSYQQALEIYERLASENPKVTEFQSELADSHHLFSMMEIDQGRFAEARDRIRKAIVHQRRALAAKPTSSIYRSSLRQHFLILLETAKELDDESLAAEAKLGIAELISSNPANSRFSERIDEILDGDTTAETEELLKLAQFGYDQFRFATAARLFGQALERDPALATNRQTQVAYNAACCAALASSGESIEEDAFDDVAKTKLRNRALTWLQDELQHWKDFASEHPEQVAAVEKTLEHWQQDADLRSIRDSDAIDKLTALEQADWRKLWSDVEALLGEISKHSK